jgi:hypothetical protein
VTIVITVKIIIIINIKHVPYSVVFWQVFAKKSEKTLRIDPASTPAKATMKAAR